MSEPLVAIHQGQLAMATPAIPFSWAIHPDAIWILCGPLGSGKTTLLKTMLGLLLPHAGEFRLFGADLWHLAPARVLELRKRVGVVWESDGLIPAWSVRDNLALLLRHHNVLNEAKRLAYVQQLFELAGEEPRILYQPAATLKPEQRRVMALLRAISMDPDLLLLDSSYPAFGTQDPHLRHLTRHLMRPGRAIVVHAAPSAASLFPPEQTRLAVVLDGGIMAAGPMDQVLNQGPTQVRHWLQRHLHG